MLPSLLDWFNQVRIAHSDAVALVAGGEEGYSGLALAVKVSGGRRGLRLAASNACVRSAMLQACGRLTGCSAGGRRSHLHMRMHAAGTRVPCSAAAAHAPPDRCPLLVRAPSRRHANPACPRGTSDLTTFVITRSIVAAGHPRHCRGGGAVHHPQGRLPLHLHHPAGRHNRGGGARRGAGAGAGGAARDVIGRGVYMVRCAAGGCLDAAGQRCLPSCLPACPPGRPPWLPTCPPIPPPPVVHLVPGTATSERCLPESTCRSFGATPS